MNTRTLEYLISVAELKSITRASERHFISQAALSQHISNVEKSVGASLFVYKGGAMQLTDAGVIFINSCRKILYLEKQIDALMKEEVDVESEIITINNNK